MEIKLERFVEAQASDYAHALNEISNGKKIRCWMWYVFPQIAGLGHSEMSKKYAIQNLPEAELYLSHEILGKRLIEISQALLKIEKKTAREIFGSPDDVKLKSCMTLFSLSKGAHPIFGQVLVKYFDGKRCSKTLKILQAV